MTDTLREGMIQALATICETVTGAATYRSREAAIARTEGITVTIRPEEESVSTPSAAVAVRDLVIMITVIARGAIPDKVADSTIQAIHAAVALDQTLGGRVARIIEDSTKWDFEVADQNAVAVEIRYRLRYLTPATSLAVLQ